MNKKIVFIICLLICALFIFLNCKTPDELQKIKASGVLFVGTTGDYIPMSYYNKKENKYEGYDIALVEDLAKSLDVEIKYVKTSWPNLMQDTTTNKFDLAIGGITITKDRKEKALMSKGYLKNGKTILCRCEDIEKYKNIEQINKPEVRVMENPGGLNEKFARENLPNAKIIIHNINEEIPNLIARKKADVMITEIMEAKYYASKDKRLALPLGENTLTEGEIGIMLPKENKTLLRYINNFLKQEEETGRLEELHQNYTNKVH